MIKLLFSSGLRLRYQFSSTSQSFRSRSKLSEFYKATHPDLLSNAPDHVKEENTRSLKYLNSYFDSLSQNQRADGMELTFYVPSKTNKKARKFYPIQVSFDSYRGDANEEIQRLAIDRSTQTLVQRVNEKQKEIDEVHLLKKPGGVGINVDKTWFTQENLKTIKRDILDETGPIKRQRANGSNQFLQHELFAQANREKWEELTQKLQREMYQANYPHSKTMAWQQLVPKENQFYDNIFDIFTELIDPRLIFMDQSLSKREIQKFKTRIIPDIKNMEQLSIIKDVFSDMEQSKPNIQLYVTKEYSSDDIPGFFSIPYNFDASQLKDCYIEIKLDILRKRQIYETELNNIHTIEINLRQKFNINKITNSIKLKNTQQAYEVKMILLKFQSALSQINDEIHLNNLKHMMSQITNSHIFITEEEDCKFEKDRLYIGLYFNVQKLKNLLI